MSRARLRWLDGRISEMEVDPRVTIIEVQMPERNHSFRSTEEIDDDGFDIFKEESESKSGQAITGQ